MSGAGGTLQSLDGGLFRRVACAVRQSREPPEFAQWAFAVAAREDSVKTRLLLESMGASLLLLFCDYLPFFHPQNHDLYHHGLPVTNLAAGIMIDLALVACLCMALLLWCDSAR